MPGEPAANTWNDPMRPHDDKVPADGQPGEDEEHTLPVVQDDKGNVTQPESI